MQRYVQSPCPSEETLEGCVGKGITHVLLCSFCSSPLFSIFSLWNMCVCFLPILLWHCPSLCPSWLCNATCCAGICWTGLEQLQTQQPLEVLLGWVDSPGGLRYNPLLKAGSGRRSKLIVEDLENTQGWRLAASLDNLPLLNYFSYFYQDFVPEWLHTKSCWRDVMNNYIL